MHRREFLKKTLGGSFALAATGMSGLTFAQDFPNTPVSSDTAAVGNRAFSKLRGVNLGAWLVLEKWMVPEVYHGTEVSDEYGLCLTLGSQATGRLERHRETFITTEDFRWIRDRGLNAVRLPVGYWALEAPRPYVECRQFVDFALDQSLQRGLKLLLDLHGAPGSQNGWDHSGRSGPIGWSKDPKNVEETLRVLESFAQKYGKHPALFGIELLNEPSDQIPIEILKDFYQDAYSRIRKHVGPEVAIIFHDSFRAMAWKNFMKGAGYANVLIDTHLYQTFNDEDRERTAQEQVVVALNRKGILDRMQREELPTFVGEWSLALPNHSLRNLSPFQGDLVNGAYADAQLLSFESTSGWFFWSYKLESDSEWNFRYCVERGWLPDSFPD